MSGETDDFEARVCPTHRVVLAENRLCGERFKDRFGNSTFCDTVVEQTLVEKHRLDKAEERSARITENLECELACAERYKQALHNVNAHIGIEASDSTQAEIRREIEDALHPERTASA